MFESKFEHRIFIVFSPNELNCSHVSTHSSYTDALRYSLKEFCDCGFEIYESRLVNRVNTGGGSNDN